MSLFKSTDEFIKYAHIDGNTTFEQYLKPYIDQAEILFLKDLIGPALYDALHADYTDNYDPNALDPPAAMNADLAALLPYVQRSLAYYSLFHGIIEMGSNVGNLGVTVSRGEKSDPAPKWKVDERKVQCITSADRFADELLKFLEENASGVKYADWYQTVYDTRAEGLIVRNAAIANKHIDISESRRIFLRMKKRIRTIEPKQARMLVGQAQYDELVTLIQGDAVTDSAQLLIDLLEPIISKMALAQTLPALRISITDSGVTLLSSNDSTISKMAAPASEVKHYINELTRGDFGYMNDIEELKNFINENIDDYPLIKASTAYTSKADPGPKHQIENNADNRYFAT